MKLSSDHALEEIKERLSLLVGDADVLTQVQLGPHGARGEDVLVQVGDFAFLVVYKNAASAASVSMAVDGAREGASTVGSSTIPLVAVPFMSETGQRICEEAGVAWLDLSGNARIRAPGLRVWIEGHPNRYKERGRPSSPFAPKSARIARWLLTHPGEATSQRELAQKTGMDEGQTSRVVTRLLEDRLVTRDGEGLIHVRDRALLLDAWHEVYDFSKHEIIKGHIAARSGEELMKRLVEASQLSCTMTGLAAAWQMTHFAGFRLTTAYLEKRPEPAVLEALGFREEERGANTWLILPNDGGVFQGAKNINGVRCVHPVQAYMDLKGIPERAEEAAADLREAIMKGTLDAE